MKIKLKQASPWHKWLPSILVAGFLFFSFFLLKTGEGLSFGSFWRIMLSRAREQDFFIYLLMLILPWLVLLSLGLTAYRLIQRYWLNRSADSFIGLSFDSAGVLLEKKAPHRPVFLPYAETDFSLELQPLIQYDKWGNASWTLGGFKLSFSQQGNSFSVYHQAGLAFLQTILDEGKKFKSCTPHALPVNARKILTPQEQQFVHFLEEQFENHRRYGLVLQDFPQNRWMLLTAGIIHLITVGIILAVCLRVLPRFHAFPVFYIVLGLLSAGTLFLGGYFLKKYWAGRAVEKRLLAQKNKLLK